MSQTSSVIDRNASLAREHQEQSHRICERCVLGTGDNCFISFDAEGVCNYCREFELRWAQLPHSEADRARALEAIIGRIKNGGVGQTYDSILGVSGGIDSTYLAYVASRLGLRPLVVHFDNGWNSEVAVQNVENLVNKLGFDLQTYVIDWDDFREMQLAYLRASVIDIEVLTDHAILGTLYKMAMERNIPFILSGANEATEGILPFDWVYKKADYVNIQAIYKAFGQRPLRNYPFLNYRTKRRVVKSGIEIIELLNIVEYNKADAKATIQRELGWRDYGGKHYESLWTRFYQGFILPRKFGVDKRKAHLSTLINSGQITKEEALCELRSPAYPVELLDKDYAFILKKLGLSRVQFEQLLDLPVRSHREFETEGSLFHYLPVLKPLRPLWEHFKRSTGLDRDRLRMLVRR